MKNTVDDDCGDVSEGCTTAVAEGFAEAADDAVESGATVKPFIFFLGYLFVKSGSRSGGFVRC